MAKEVLKSNIFLTIETSIRYPLRLTSLLLLALLYNLVFSCLDDMIILTLLFRKRTSLVCTK